MELFSTDSNICFSSTPIPTLILKPKPSAGTEPFPSDLLSPPLSPTFYPFLSQRTLPHLYRISHRTPHFSEDWSSSNWPISFWGLRAQPGEIFYPSLISCIFLSSRICCCPCHTRDAHFMISSACRKRSIWTIGSTQPNCFPLPEQIGCTG